MEREARSSRELQALQAANNRAATAARQHSRQAARARSAPPLSALSWGFAGNASRAGGLNGSLQRKNNLWNMAPKCHPGRSKFARKSLQHGSREPPGLPPRAQPRTGSLFALLFHVWGGSRGAPGSLLAAPGALLAPLGPCLALPGRSWEPFSSPRGLLWDLFGSLFPTPLEKHENLDFRRQLQRKSRFGRPRGVQNRAKMAPKSLLGASWRLLALSWRLSALSLASLGGLLALLGPLGRLLGRSWGDL